MKHQKSRVFARLHNFSCIFCLLLCRIEWFDLRGSSVDGLGMPSIIKDRNSVGNVDQIASNSVELYKASLTIVWVHKSLQLSGKNLCEYPYDKSYLQKSFLMISWMFRHKFKIFCKNFSSQLEIPTKNSLTGGTQIE